MDPVSNVAEEEEDQQGPPQETDDSGHGGQSNSSTISARYDLPFLPETCFPGSSVWDFNISNLMEPFTKIITYYPFIAVQTRYILSKESSEKGPIPPPSGTPDEAYNQMVENLDKLFLVQIAFTFADADWNRFRITNDRRDFLMQFNFKFADSAEEEVDESDRAEMKERGVNVLMHTMKGLDLATMALFLWSTGPIMTGNVCWVSYDPAHDFATLLKIVRVTKCGILPESLNHFLELVGIYFPKFYDVRHLAESCELGRGSLMEMVKAAGLVESDENWGRRKPEVVLIMELFRELARTFPGGKVPEEHANVITGLGRRP